MKILVGDAGQVTAVYNDRHLGLARRLGHDNPNIDRASNVEWDGKAWVATSCRTGEVLATEPTREQALKKEVAAIESNLAAYA
jgi:hypothetical protein